MKTKDIQKHFIEELKNENFVIDKTGQKTIEMIGASFLADKPSIFGKPNDDYIQAEIDWYDRMSTNINDIYRGDFEPPKAWQYSANEFGEINSNYGLLIYGKKYHKQYKKVLSELSINPDSRRGTMIYQRPSIWYEYNENGKNDFICTNAVTYYIRNGKLHCVVQMRSNDVVFGYKNDYAWQKEVLEMLRADLYFEGIELKEGDIHWQVQNLHVYERHFDLVK
tara:strand:- start:233 stop:901 length:669 start_codon:yes stop_codon:yes gene_type:complete